MQNKQFISDIEPIGSAGKKVESPFSIKYRHPPKAYKNGFMFTLGLADKTGEIEATFWGGKDENEVRNLYSSMKDDNVIYISGTVGVFRDKTKIDINDINGIKLCKEEEYNLEDFVPVSEKDINLMFSELLKIVDSIKNIHLKALLDLFFKDSVFSDKFKKAPAAMYIHHAYIGGLLEHTLNVTKICEFVQSLYPSIDKDLIISGALLHDMGKIKEFLVTSNIKESEEGMLIGHITLGEQMLNENIKKIIDFPEILRIKLCHILLSHHGNGEYGSPEEPCFPEAVTVYYADEYDSKIKQYVSIAEDGRQSTEDFRIYSKRLGQIFLR